MKNVIPLLLALGAADLTAGASPCYQSARATGVFAASRSPSM